WQTSKTRRAGVSSFGLSGTNAHIILEEYKASAATTSNTATDNWFKIAAKSKNALKEYIDSIHNFIAETTPIEDLAYTLNTGRKDYKYRLAVSGNTIAEIKKSLLSQKENDEITTAKYSKIALLYLSDAVPNVENF
ncbi:hypothetical protein D0809_26825, partial [Flavobacterium circumlabens]